MKAFADKTVAFFMEQVRSTVGDIPVMFAVGNSDSYIGALTGQQFSFQYGGTLLHKFFEWHSGSSDIS